MGIAERKEREREEVKDLILNAAREIFLSEGYENTSIRKIATKIEYSPGIIYHHFKDKNDLERRRISHQHAERKYQSMHGGGIYQDRSECR